MLLDYVLTVVSGACLFANSFLALIVTTRPPSERRRVYYEVAFGVLGTIGVVAVIWGGIRTAVTNNHVEAGVKHTETAVTTTIPKKIDTQGDAIATLKSQIGTQSGQLGALQYENGTLATQNGKLIAQNNLLDGEIKKIAAAAHLDAAPEGSAQQLADAIIEKLSSVGQRVSALEARDPNTLYMGVKEVGRVANIKPIGSTVSFTLTANAQVDFSKPFYLQWAEISCPPAQAGSSMSSGAFVAITYPVVSCTIVGRAP
jgi:hypothetical protein